MACPPVAPEEDELLLTPEMAVHRPPPWGWEKVTHPWIAEQLHLVPTWDTGMHSFDPPCRCGAYVDEECGALLIHHVAFDGRCAYENGSRKHH